MKGSEGPEGSPVSSVQPRPASDRRDTSRAKQCAVTEKVRQRSIQEDLLLVLDWSVTFQRPLTSLRVDPRDCEGLSRAPILLPM